MAGRNETVTTILRRIDIEVADLLEREPLYHGKMVFSLNFHKGKFMNMRCDTGKMVLGEKVKKT